MMKVWTASVIMHNMIIEDERDLNDNLEADGINVVIDPTPVVPMNV